MREACCGSMIPAIIVCYFIIIRYLLIYFFSAYSGSMRAAFCGNMMLVISMYY
jgi:hypothetical protein